MYFDHDESSVSVGKFDNSKLSLEKGRRKTLVPLSGNI